MDENENLKLEGAGAAQPHAAGRAAPRQLCPFHTSTPGIALQTRLASSNGGSDVQCGKYCVGLAGRW